MVPLTAKKANTQGEQDAEAGFESLFQEHWSRVFGVLYRLVGESAEAEDLALETFLRLYDHRHSVEGEVGGWLYRVATHLGFNTLRARRRRRHYETEAGRLNFEENQVEDPADELERTQERQLVRAVLSEMKPRSAQMLVLRHSGLSYNEIAAALGVAPGSVGTLLARAEAEFEECYQTLEGESHASR
jgi:RNA polymerase sigma-70 factor (ECF subfamily)